MARFLAFALLLLAGSAAFAQQPAPDKPTSAIPNKGQNSAPPAGGAAIPPELRSNSTKDIPMGNGKPKEGAPAATERNDKGRK
jgi:hypothetical protein